MTASVLLAGLPEGMEGWLEHRLAPDALVERTDTEEQILAHLTRGTYDLLVLDHRVGGAEATLLARLRSQPGLASLPILYCVAAERALESVLSAAHAWLDAERDPHAAALPGLVSGLRSVELLFYPLDRDDLGRRIAEMLRLPDRSTRGRASAPPGAQDPSGVVAALWQRFKGANLERVAVLEQAARTLLAGTWKDQDDRRAAEQAAHKLAGSVGTYGFAEGSRLALEIQHLLQDDASAGPSGGQRLADLAAALRKELEHPLPEAPATVVGGRVEDATPPASSASPPPPGLPPYAAQPHPSAPIVITHSLKDWPLLLIVDNDPSLTGRLAVEAAAHDIRAEVAPDRRTAREAFDRLRPDVVLLDLSFPDGPDDGLDLLGELSSRTPLVPVFVLTARDGFTDRVEVARRGGRGFLQKPLPPSQVLEAITLGLRQARAKQASILAVDDDPQILASLRAFLEPENISVRTLDDPRRFGDTLEEAVPDLLVLDLDMPHVNGIELCRVVRADARWNGLPILFLTANTDADSLQQVFAAGADDYVAKPIIVPELLTRIANRLERMRLHRSLAETDPLTGLPNRRKALQLLDSFRRLAERYGQPFSVAVLDLDHFKRVNDQHGHAAGDAVLRQLADLLRQTFRGEDVVARWGGEEFMVGMYGMLRYDGVHRLAETLEMLREIEFPSALGGEPFRVTFSAGVAQYVDDGRDIQSLYRVADQALYRAKAAGRDRILPYAGPVSDPADGAAQLADVALVLGDAALGGPLLDALVTRGYQARWLHDARDAAERLGTLRPRVALLDMTLPELGQPPRDGSLSLEPFMRAAGHTRIVALASEGSTGRPNGPLSEAFDVVSAPFTVPQLLQRVRRALQA